MMARAPVQRREVTQVSSSFLFVLLLGEPLVFCKRHSWLQVVDGKEKKRPKKPMNTIEYCMFPTLK
jgi:hypothetical protein